MELNHSAYVYSKRSVDYFNDYAKKTKGVDKVDFDLDQPEGYVVKSKRPSSSKPKKKPEAKKPAKTEPKKGEKKPEKKDPEPSVPAIDIGEPGK